MLDQIEIDELDERDYSYFLAYGDPVTKSLESDLSAREDLDCLGTSIIFSDGGISWNFPLASTMSHTMTFGC